MKTLVNVKRKMLALGLTALVAGQTVMSGQIPVAQAAGGEMSLYGIYLKANPGEESYAASENEFGDAVLLESGGEALLMDTGAIYTSDSTIQVLKNKGITELNLYVSHLHPDHYQALSVIHRAGIHFGKIFVPDQSIGADWVSENGGTTRSAYRQIENLAEEDGTEVVYLKKGDSFTIGDVSAEVLGPVGNYDMDKCKQYFPNNVYGERSGHYLNNYSLTTMFTCDGVRYLTTGDIESIENQQGSGYGSGIKKLEEEYLVDTYGSRLQADILKMAHHGLNSSSSEAFLSAVKPRIAFAENTGYQDYANVSGKKIPKYYSPVSRMHEHGITYMNGHEKAGIGITVKNGQIAMYRDKNNDAKLSESEKLTGWVSVKGIANKTGTDFTGDDVYYVDPSSSDFGVATGIQKIGSKTFLFEPGGALQRAFYKGSSYLGWRTYDKDYRYFDKPDSQGRAAMAVGFKKIGANYFYFDKKTGFRFAPKKGDSNSKGKAWKLKKIGKYKYLIKKGNGAVFNMGKKKNAFMSFSGGKLRAFDKKGRMITGKAKVNGRTYKFDKKTGYRK